MNRLAEIVSNKTLEDCSKEDLIQLTIKYPFFNAGHLLLIQKMKIENPLQLSEFSQKAGLHFPSLILTSILTGAGRAKIISPKEPETITQGVVQPEPEIINYKQEVTVIEELTTGNVEQAITHQESIIQDPHPETADEQQVTGNGQPTPDIQPSTSNTEPLSFEPFHTVDYFASQGIKIKLDENPTDKFSKQLKSFTEWLKTMKRLPAENISVPAISVIVEQKVEQLAESSLNKADVITEAMAEVWEKQGNPEKAIEIYHKLSLIEPAKSLYFATRISDLKKTN